MLSDVVGRYIDSLEEREFDGPFIAMLRAMDYRDIHFLHGSFEFGKDFIAKAEPEGIETQFAFQTKAGNINLKSWNECRGQIDMLRTSPLSHPSFDKGLPRIAVFVTTGRLVGGAAAAAQEYGNHLSVLGELGFTTWDRDNLIEFIAADPGILLGTGSDGAFLSLIGQIDQGDVTDADIERYSQQWLSGRRTLYHLTIEAALIAQRLRTVARLDLSCVTAVALLRASWMRSHGAIPVDSISQFTAEKAVAMFRLYAWLLFDACGNDMLDPDKFLLTNGSPALHVTYPVLCLRLVEILGLLYLLEQEESCIRRSSLGQFLVSFIEANPGVSHPISDRWAVSLIPGVLALAQRRQNQVINDLLRSTTKWVADRYDSGSLGLSAVGSSPQAEVDRLLGDPFEHIKLDRRAESYLATVILDLEAILGLGEAFETTRNEFLAVQLCPTLVESPDTTAQYGLTGNSGLSYNANVEFGERWKPKDGWKVAPHHARASSDYYLQRVGRYWDHLALSFLLRDRHFVGSCRHFLPVS